MYLNKYVYNFDEYQDESFFFQLMDRERKLFERFKNYAPRTFEKSSFPLDRKIEKNGKRMGEKERKREVSVLLLLVHSKM